MDETLEVVDILSTEEQMLLSGFSDGDYSTMDEDDTDAADYKWEIRTVCGFLYILEKRRQLMPLIRETYQNDDDQCTAISAFCSLLEADFNDCFADPFDPIEYIVRPARVKVDAGHIDEDNLEALPAISARVRK